MPVPGQTMTPTGTTSSVWSLRLNEAALACLANPAEGDLRDLAMIGSTGGDARLDMRRHKQRHPSPGRAADKNSADNRKGLAPAFGGNADMREPKRRMVAGDGRRYGIEERESGPDERRSHRCEGDLSDRQGRAASEDTDNERADHSGAAMEGGEARSYAAKNGSE
jgi:hypothetical protein